MGGSERGVKGTSCDEKFRGLGFILYICEFLTAFYDGKETRV